MALQSAANLAVFITTNNSSWDIANAAPFGTIELNTWTHYALTRNGSTFRTFKNGIIGSTINNAASIYSSLEHHLQIGVHYALYVPGYFDEFRVSNVARWTANFTPPTAPY